MTETVHYILSVLEKINKTIFDILFFDLAGGSIVVDGKTVALPFLVIFIFLGVLFFSLWFRFINVRGFLHAIRITRGVYDKPGDTGDVSHFRALTSALSATVGLGNIAGVAIAIQKGGPGAVFWMMLTAILGMSAKFSSCTLSQVYRKVNSDGTISGGPMYYLDLGFKQLGKSWAPLGKLLAIMFAVMVMGGAIGGGNMFQVNQTVEIITANFDLPETAPLVIGIVMAILVGVVIIGGIKSIGYATSRLVPTMCGIYIIASLVVIIANIHAVPEALSLIFTMAFTENAAFGGMLGVMVQGITRAAFSSESGLGSSSIAHAAAKTEEPVREGMVAMLEPFIDTVVVCLMTALVVIVSGVWNDPNIGSGSGNIGVSLTSEAFRTVIPWFPYVLTACIFLFAYSTMLSWCYYAERGWIYLWDHIAEGTGLKTVVIFRLVFISAIIYGAIKKLAVVLDFSDALLLSMAFPNILGSMLLAPVVLKLTKDYWVRYKKGEFKKN